MILVTYDSNDHQRNNFGIFVCPQTPWMFGNTGIPPRLVLGGLLTGVLRVYDMCISLIHLCNRWRITTFRGPFWLSERLFTSSWSQVSTPNIGLCSPGPIDSWETTTATAFLLGKVLQPQEAEMYRNELKAALTELKAALTVPDLVGYSIHVQSSRKTHQLGSWSTPTWHP